ncbi:MAG: sugar phosphate isomerase/epimerase [Pseudobutyrivibrio sp.]|nr:sugar phosphate isomerase/epimerase [Pseudobutyrivibrio sp.]
MKLSISNIGWSQDNDETIYELMKKYDYQGIEIAPTRIFPDNPYDCRQEVADWSEAIDNDYGFCVSSMQSIWFGRTEMVFGNDSERHALIDYTKKAIDFAAAAGCNNLVFGCPKSRVTPENMTSDEIDEIAVAFFKELGDYAFESGTAIGMEANPPIYNTNYINDTVSAIELIKKVNSPGFKLNLDLGTMIQNNESVDMLEGQVNLINHVHISEPYLAPIEHRKLHEQLITLLKREDYQGFISIEMGKQEDMAIIEAALSYVRSIV